MAGRRGCEREDMVGWVEKGGGEENGNGRGNRKRVQEREGRPVKRGGGVAGRPSRRRERE